MLEKEGTFTLDVDGEEISLTPEDVEVEVNPRPSVAVVEGDGMMVALDIKTDDTLVDEGFAREIVHVVQNLRKSSGFEISDRIEIEYEATECLGRAIQSHSDYIQSETLCLSMVQKPGVSGESCDVNGESLTLALRRVG